MYQSQFTDHTQVTASEKEGNLIHWKMKGLMGEMEGKERDDKMRKECDKDINGNAGIPR